MSEYDILAKYEGLRLTDVCDGMDALRRQDIGLVAGDIRPLWRDIDNFSHRFCGLAYTVRFMPTARPVDAYEPQDFETWKGNWYRTYAGGPPVDEIQKGDVIVIDGGEIGTVGFIGSNNGFAWIAAGAVGIVTNGGARDTDELIKQRVPVYSRRVTQSIRPGRLELDSTQIPVNIGGVLVTSQRTWSWPMAMASSLYRWRSPMKWRSTLGSSRKVTNGDGGASTKK